MSECEKFAQVLMSHHEGIRFTTFDEASKWVRSQMLPGESPQIIDNIAEAIYLGQIRNAV